MENNIALPLSGERISHVLTRISLALVYLSFGYVQLQSPAGWVSYLPGILQRLPIDGQFFIFLNGTVEIVLGLFLLLGVYIRPVAFVLGVHLFGIAATIGFNAVGIRDFGLSLATLGVAFAGNDSFSLGRVLQSRARLGRRSSVLVLYAALFVMAGSALAFSVQTYDGPFRAAGTPGTQTGEGLAVTATPGIPLSVETVARHTTAGDCWIIVNNRVYAVSEYVPFHPGGEKRITDLCGKDATIAFNTKGGMGSDHSNNARTLLEQYFVGAIGEAVVAGAPSPVPGSSPAASATTTPKATTTPTPAPASALTAASVATHSSASSCWLIISGNVYDVTAYIPFHPGGTNRILTMCGKEATSAFNTKGGAGSAHSNYAKTLLAQYLIGALGATATLTPAPTVSPSPTLTPTPAVTITPAPATSLTTAAVATHNSASDCWIIVSGNVYNVTAYIPFHPGGTNRIVNVCGQEATTAFNTRGGSGNHSSNARSLLGNYLLGALGSTVTPTPTLSPGVTPTAVPGDPLAQYRAAILEDYPGATITQLTLEDDGRAEFRFTYNGNSYEGKMNAQYQITDIE